MNARIFLRIFISSKEKIFWTRRHIRNIQTRFNGYNPIGIFNIRQGMEPKKCSIKNCPYYSISPEINNCSQHYKQSINLSHEKLQNSTLQDHIINQKNISGNITNNQDNIRNIIFNLSSIFSYYLYNFETTCDQDENFKLFSNKKFKGRRNEKSILEWVPPQLEEWP